MDAQSRPVAIMKELGLLSWAGLAIGLDRGWATKADVIRFAVEQLMCDADDPAKRIAILAGADAMSVDEVREYLSKIGTECNGGASSTALELDKWRLAHLVSVERRSYSPDDLLDSVAEIYAEFGYPGEMWLTSRYNLTPEDHENLKAGKPAHDPIVAVQEVIRALRLKLLGE